MACGFITCEPTCTNVSILRFVGEDEEPDTELLGKKSEISLVAPVHVPEFRVDVSDFGL